LSRSDSLCVSLSSLSATVAYAQPPRPLAPTLFPYTTLFRSEATREVAREAGPGPRDRRHADRHGREARGAQRGDGLIASLAALRDRKSTGLNSSHEWISYAVFCLKKKKNTTLTVI